VFGCWVWLLVAATQVANPLLQGWSGKCSPVYVPRDEASALPFQDSLCHGTTAILYMSAAVLQ
ncbi:hypothetical protein HPG69_011263, partial [Diceros bicornis minor]